MDTVIWLCETYGYKDFAESAVDAMQKASERTELLEKIQILTEQNIIDKEPPVS